MNRLVREHFGPRGNPKRGFATADEAHEFRRLRNGLRRKQAYLCTICERWHLGTSRRAA